MTCKNNHTVLLKTLYCFTEQQTIFQWLNYPTKPIPVAVRSMVKVCTWFIAGIGLLNPTEGTGVRLLCLFGVVKIAASKTN
jgi:hypothetical protein